MRSIVEDLRTLGELVQHEERARQYSGPKSSGLSDEELASLKAIVSFGEQIVGEARRMGSIRIDWHGMGGTDG
jgi:hypothetical protein